MGPTIAAFITASVVVTVGSISYIGLIVPNVVALFKGDKIRGALADVALFGALFVLVCDIAARTVIAPYELPIELIVGIVSNVIFIGLLLYRLNRGRRAVGIGPRNSGGAGPRTPRPEIPETSRECPQAAPRVSPQALAPAHPQAEGGAC